MYSVYHLRRACSCNPSYGQVLLSTCVCIAADSLRYQASCCPICRARKLMANADEQRVLVKFGSQSRERECRDNLYQAMLAASGVNLPDVQCSAGLQY